MNRLHLMSLGFISLIAVFSTPIASPAQQKGVEKVQVRKVEKKEAEAPTEDKRLQQQLDQMEATEKAAVSKILELRLDELKRVCELDGKQVKRLQIAAKGVAKRAGQKRREAYAEIMNRRPRVPIRAVAPAIRLVPAIRKPKAPVSIKKVTPTGKAKKKIAEKAVDEKARQEAIKRKDAERLAQQRRMEELQVMKLEAMFAAQARGGAFRAANRNPQRDPLWQKAVSTTLTEEQQAKYQNHLDKRTSHQLTVRITQIVGGLDTQLLLTEKQREQIAALARKHLAKPQANADPFARSGGLPDESMKRILSESQFKTWKGEGNSRGQFRIRL